MESKATDNLEDPSTRSAKNPAEGMQFSKQAADREALSRWYLARLRRRAHMGGSGANLTPAALIAADRDRIERMIVDNVNESGKRKTLALPAVPSRRPWGPVFMFLFISGAVLQIALISSIILGNSKASGSDSGSANGLVFVLLALLLAWFAVLFGTSLKFYKKLKRLNAELLDPDSDEFADENVDELDRLRYTFQQHKQDFEELQEKERAIVDYADDIVCSLDLELNFTSVNPAPSRLLGYSSEELLGRSLSTFVLSDDWQKSEQSLANSRDKKREAVIENRLRARDGSYLDLFWQVEWSQTAGAYFCVAHDITIRKNTERGKQEFVAMLSHDLRSPLTSVQGSLTLLKEGALGELSKQALLRVQSADRICRQLIRLVNDLLDIEKIEAGKFELAKEEFLLSEIIEAARETLETLAEQKSISMKLDNSTIRINADRDRLFRVLVNLLSNAIKFSPENSSISVELALEEAFVRVSVIDQGRGISTEDQAKIFDRFQQVEMSDASLKGGSGLGLAICKAIIERHGGNISVESSPGKGSTFKFLLPR